MLVRNPAFPCDACIGANAAVDTGVIAARCYKKRARTRCMRALTRQVFKAHPQDELRDLKQVPRQPQDGAWRYARGLGVPGQRSQEMDLWGSFELRTDRRKRLASQVACSGLLVLLPCCCFYAPQGWQCEGGCSKPSALRKTRAKSCGLRQWPIEGCEVTLNLDVPCLLIWHLRIKNDLLEALETVWQLLPPMHDYSCSCVKPSLAPCQSPWTTTMKAVGFLSVQLLR